MERRPKASSEATRPDGDRFVTFESYNFDRVGGLLSKNGHEVVLPPRVARLLTCLLETPGEVVPKELLIAETWDGVSVSDQSLAEAVSQARRALDDDPNQPRFIQTVHRRGYRFLALVSPGQNCLYSPVGPTPSAQPGQPGDTGALADARISVPKTHPPTVLKVDIRTLSIVTIILVLVIVGSAPIARYWLARRAESHDRRFSGSVDEQWAALSHVEDQREVLRQEVASAFASKPRVDIYEGVNPSSYGASPSPDGRFIALGGEGAAPSLYRVQDDRTIPLAVQERPPGYLVATNPVFSPDSRRVAFAVLDEMWEQAAELRVLGTDGPAMTTLHRGDLILPHAWLPDGSKLVAIRPAGSAMDIVDVSVETGVVSTLKTLTGRYADMPRRISLSPDGRTLAYDFKQADGSAQRDIYLLSLADGGESQIVRHPANDLLPMWTPDGDGVLFISNRDGSYAVWVASLGGGEVRGPAELLLPGVSSMMWPLGLVEDGSLFYGVGSVVGSDVYIASLEPSTYEVSEEPIKVVPEFPGLNLGPTWSPDGRQLAHLSQRGLVLEPDTVIAISRVNEGRGRVEQERVPGLPYIRNPRWSPDGLTILMRGYNRSLVWGLYLLDLASGETTSLIQDDRPGSSTMTAPQWWPGGGGVAYGRRSRESIVDPGSGIARETRVWTLLRRDFGSEHDREIYRVVDPATLEGWALSPDGSRLAVSIATPEADTYRITLQVVPLAGGEPRVLMDVLAPLSLRYPVWTPDGSRVLIVKGPRELSEESELWAVDLASGGTQPVGISLPGLRNIALGPGGRRIAFVASTQASTSQVWALRNFLPTSQGTISGEGEQR